MKNVNAFTKLTCLALVALGVASATGCAGGGDEDENPNDEAAAQGDTASSEDELGAGAGCTSKATYIAKANRVCGPSNYRFHHDKAVTRYRRGGDWKHCAPNSFVDLPFTCN